MGFSAYPFIRGWPSPDLALQVFGTGGGMALLIAIAPPSPNFLTNGEPHRLDAIGPGAAFGPQPRG